MPCVLWFTVLFSTALIPESRRQAIAEYYRGPRHISKQYPLDNIQKLFRTIDNVVEDPRVVIQAISEELLHEVPTFTRLVTFQSYLISWMHWLLPNEFRERLDDYTSVAEGYGPYKHAIEAIQLR